MKLSRLFNRVSSVSIVGLESIDISGLRIVFDIAKSSSSESNKGTVDIYNLAKSTRNKIESLDARVIVRAGYKELSGEEVVSVGDITRINHINRQPEVISTIEFSDGDKALKESRISIEYREGTSYKQIIKDVILSFNVVRQFSLADIPGNDMYASTGYAFIGNASTALDELTKILGLEWSFQNYEIKIQEKGIGDNSRIISLSPSSGLIGSPEKLEDKSSETNSSNIKQGWVVNSLLIPGAEPGGLINISSKEIKDGAVFRIKNVEHLGDTHGDEWGTRLEVFEEGKFKSIGDL